jgi:hypothetical protein
MATNTLTVFKDINFNYNPTIFPVTNLLFNFSALTGTSTTTNGATVATWTDVRTGLVGTNSSSCTYHTDVTINSHPTTTGIITTTMGSTSTVQNYWTWYGVFRTGSGSTNDFLMNSPIPIGLIVGSTGAYFRIAHNGEWLMGASSTSGGSQTSYTLSVNTNYICSIICSSNNNTSGATNTLTFRINGVDYTPGSNTQNSYFYIYNQLIGSSPKVFYTGEQTLYNTTHSLATAQQMEQYLSYKWGIGIGSTPAVATSSPYIN